ncbi:hypothetical protein SEA_XKCD426_40 [Streptomyces phage Xkcd426]|nr:hypothetical protein SEA_XKCD426_40 [Streptomyces phage Xkcd426]
MTQHDVSKPLPPYSGDNDFGPDCVKCGFDSASTEFMPDSTGFNPDRVCYGYPYRGEFLKRTCLRCGYAWAEAVIRPVPQARCGSTNQDFRCDLAEGHSTQHTDGLATW